MSDEAQRPRPRTPRARARGGRRADRGGRRADRRAPALRVRGAAGSPAPRNIELNELSARGRARSTATARCVFYCRSGNRSGMAAEAFREAGCDAHNLAGGLEAWVGRGPAARARPTARSPAAAAIRRALPRAASLERGQPQASRPATQPAPGGAEGKPATGSQPAAQPAPQSTEPSRSRACGPGSPSSTASSGSAAIAGAIAIVLALAAGIVGVVLALERQGRERDQGRGRPRFAIRSRPSTARGLAGRRGRPRPTLSDRIDALEAGSARSPRASGRPSSELQVVQDDIDELRGQLTDLEGASLDRHRAAARLGLEPASGARRSRAHPPGRTRAREASFVCKRHYARARRASDDWSTVARTCPRKERLDARGLLREGT